MNQKILLVHNYYKIPGGEDTVLNNEKMLLEHNGHEVFLYTRNNREIDNFNFLNKILFPINSIFNTKTYFELTNIIKNKQIDIVHVHNTWPLISPSAYYSAFRYHIPIVQTIHNFRMICPSATLYYNDAICEDSLYKGLSTAIKRKIYKGSFFQTLISAATLKSHRMLGTYKKINYIFLTEFNKSKVLELNNHGHRIIDETKTFIKPNFVDIQSNNIPFHERKNQFIFAGRLDKLKGIDLLLEAWTSIKYSDLIICGTGPEDKWCKDFIKKHKLSNVFMTGHISNKQTKDLIAESKALILPTQWYEGFPMTIVESFACGTPVIGSNIGNVGSLIKNGVNGNTFQFNSVSSLIYAVNNLTDMCTSTKEYYNKHYTAEINYQILSKIYSESQFNNT